MQLKDPSGGLTSEGRKYFARKEGAHLKPGVKGAANTPEKMRRKGSFLRRHFATLRGPLVNEQGKPTRLALSAHAWGEPVPRTVTAARKLAAKGTQLLERYAASKAGKKAPAKNSLVANINRRKKAGKSRKKANTTISKKAYSDMQRGWPRKKRTAKKSKKA